MAPRTTLSGAFRQLRHRNLRTRHSTGWGLDRRMDFTVPDELTALREVATARSSTARCGRSRSRCARCSPALDPDRERIYDGGPRAPAPVGGGGLLRLLPAGGGRRLGRVDAGHRAAGRGRRAVRAPARAADPRRAQPVRTEPDAAAPARAPVADVPAPGRARRRRRRASPSPSPRPAATRRRSAPRARRDGDEWVIDGMKHYITNGDRADFAVVFAVTDKEKRADGGITAFVVPREQYRVGKVQATMADVAPGRAVVRRRPGAGRPRRRRGGPRLPRGDVVPQRRPGRVRRAVARAGRALPRPRRWSTPRRGPRSAGRWPPTRACPSRSPSARPRSRRCAG